MRMIGFDYEREKCTEAYLCSECGLCGMYSCPMGLFPDRVNKILKTELINKKVANNRKSKIEKTSNIYETRLVPTERLMKHLNLDDIEAKLTDEKFEFQKVRIPLKQHTGAPSNPVVHVGDKVRKNDLIAKIPQGAIGSNIHSSIDGVVNFVGDWIEIWKN